MIYDSHRGHKIRIKSDIWIYCDTMESVELFKNRNCGKCKNKQTEEGHDPCLGTLKYVMNACCGHGEIREAYIQFLNRFCIQGTSALLVANILKKLF